jgi:hypothetical protein
MVTDGRYERYNLVTTAAYGGLVALLPLHPWVSNLPQFGATVLQSCLQVHRLNRLAVAAAHRVLESCSS